MQVVDTSHFAPWEERESRIRGTIIFRTSEQADAFVDEVTDEQRMKIPALKALGGVQVEPRISEKEFREIWLRREKRRR